MASNLDNRSISYMMMGGTQNQLGGKKRMTLKKKVKKEKKEKQQNKKKFTKKKMTLTKKTTQKNKPQRKRKIDILYDNLYSELNDKIDGKTIESVYQIFNDELVKINNEIKKANKITKPLEMNLTVIKKIMEQTKTKAVNSQNQMMRYPSIYDSEFNKKIFYKYEFYSNKIQKNINKINEFFLRYNKSKKTQKVNRNIDIVPDYDRSQDTESDNILISDRIKLKNFDLSSAQRILKNFMSPRTHYNGILIFHGVGVGKTCASISIVEQFKKKLEKYNKQIIVIRDTAIKDELFDINAVKSGNPQLQCTGTTYLDEIDEPELVNNCMSGDSESCNNLESKVNKRLKKYYSFYSTEGRKWANEIKLELQQRTKNRVGLEIEKAKKKYIKEKYSNSIILIDEAHSLRNKAESAKIVPPILREVLEYADNVKLILLSATPMYNDPGDIVSILNYLLINDGRPKIESRDLFNKDGKLTENGKKILIEKSRGYISYMRGENPIDFPIRLSAKINGDSNILTPSNWPKKDIWGNPLDKKIQYMEIVGCPMSNEQRNVYRTTIDSRTSISNHEYDVQSAAWQDERQVSNFIYMGLNKNNQDIKKCKGQVGLSGITTKNKKGQYVFKDDKYANIFGKDLKKHSSKIWELINNIEKCKGMCFVYTEFIAASLIPIIFALEMRGYTKYMESKPILNYPNKSNRKKAKYVVFSAASSSISKYSKKFKNKREQMINEGVKVILGTKAASEGLNFFGVREIHILEPWYNINSIEQAIGRGFRNKAHDMLEPKKRNITVYLYASTLPDRESIDMYMYRIAEEKAINAGEVEYILKRNSMDCQLNKERNVYLKKDYNKPIEILTSRNVVKKINVYDKPFSRICNYQEKCDYQCIPKMKTNISPNDIDTSTYDTYFLEYDVKRVMRLIRELYKHDIVFNINDIKKIVFANMNISEDQIIHIAMNNLIDKKTVVKDSYGRDGYIIYRNGNYLFQPSNIKDETISIQRRAIPLDIKTNSIDLRIYINKLRVKRQKLMNKEQYSYDDILKYIEKYFKHTMKQTTESIFTTSLKLTEKEVFNIIIDRLIYDRKNVLLKNLVKKIIEKKTLKDLENKIKPFIQPNILLFSDVFSDNNKDIYGYWIVNFDKQEFYIYNDGVFEKDIGQHNKISENQRIKFKKENKENNVVGYLSYGRDGSPDFKIKDIRGQESIKASKGGVCTHKTKSIIKNYINHLSNKKIDGKIHRPKMCNNIEVLLRRNDINKKNGNRWFFNIETFIISQL